MANPTLHVCGNLVAPAELRFTPNGVAVASFTVVTTDRRKTQTGEWEDDGEPAFWDCSVWRQAAEKLGELAWPKGHPVVVVGKLKQRSYEARDGGGKRRATDLLVDAVGTDEVALSRRQASQPARSAAADPWKPSQPSQPANDPWAATATSSDAAPF